LIFQAIFKLIRTSLSSLGKGPGISSLDFAFKGPRKPRRLICVLLAFCWLSAFPVTLSESAPSLEYQVKAAFVYKFIKFIQWPTNTEEDNPDRLVITILGESPIFEALKSLLPQKAQGRRVVLKKADNAQELRFSHIVFIGNTQDLNVKFRLSQVRKNGLLTISDTRGFAKSGGMINFIREKEKIRFEMNPEAAKNSGIKISSKLLRLARIVNTKHYSGGN